MSAIQGAMAIRRERQKRETRRLSQIKRQGRGADGGQAGSSAQLMAGGDEHVPPVEAPQTKSGGMTAFHLGVVFILLGFLMVFSGLIANNDNPGTGNDGNDWSRLLGVGTTFIILGLVMVMVNRILTAREEEELTKYVSHRLGRTRSGHALARDAESAYELRQQQQQKQKQKQMPAISKLRPKRDSSLKKEESKRLLGSKKAASKDEARAAASPSDPAKAAQNGAPPQAQFTTEVECAAVVAPSGSVQVVALSPQEISVVVSETSAAALPPRYRSPFSPKGQEVFRLKSRAATTSSAAEAPSGGVEPEQQMPLQDQDQAHAREAKKPEVPGPQKA